MRQNSVCETFGDSRNLTTLNVAISWNLLYTPLNQHCELCSRNKMQQLSNKHAVALKQDQTFHLCACRLERMMTALLAEYGRNWQNNKIVSWSRNFALHWCWNLLFSVNLKEEIKLEAHRQTSLTLHIQLHTCQTGHQTKRRGWCLHKCKAGNDTEYEVA